MEEESLPKISDFENSESKRSQDMSIETEIIKKKIHKDKNSSVGRNTRSKKDCKDKDWLELDLA